MISTRKVKGWEEYSCSGLPQQAYSSWVLAPAEDKRACVLDGRVGATAVVWARGDGKESRYILCVWAGSLCTVV